MEEQVSTAGSISSSKTNLPSETTIDNGRISFSNSFCNSIPSTEKLLKNELKFEEQSQLNKIMGKYSIFSHSYVVVYNMIQEIKAKVGT